MNYRLLGRTEMKISEVSFGAWAIGSSWGAVDDKTSLAALHKAVDLGVNFFDTADVYGNGRSEKLLGRLRRDRSERIFIATKAGRKLSLMWFRPRFCTRRRKILTNTAIWWYALPVTPPILWS